MYEYSENILITLNSDYAKKLNGSMNSKSEFEFSSLIDANNSDIVRVNICVLNAMIPCSFYNITQENNIFSYGYYEPSEFNNQYNLNYNSVTIEPGNYNSTTLLQQLNQGFINNNHGFLNLSYNKTNDKIKFTCDDVYVVKILILVTSTMMNVLGFDNKQYQSVLNADNFIISPYSLNLLGCKTISVQSSNLNIGSFSSYKSTYSNSLCSLNVNQPAGGIISYDNNNNNNKFMLKNRDINVIDIQLLNEKQDYLDFNNIAWSITLLVEVIKLISFVNPLHKTSFNSILKSSHKKMHLMNNQIDITDLKHVEDDLEDNNIEVLLYKLTEPEKVKEN